jgi:hypothetical protein
LVHGRSSIDSDDFIKASQHLTIGIIPQQHSPKATAMSNSYAQSWARTGVAIAIALAFGEAAQAQAFQPGSLIISGTTYAGTASTVTVGQTLSGGGKAIADGSFPNVFKNESVDAAFGVSSPIFLQQLSTSGTLISTLAIDSGAMTSSFASKSELALNVSSGGTSVSFMGYASPANALDVSNSNTSQAPDSTNLVTSTVQRTIATVDLSSGTAAFTNVNSYSGNNGRAAVLVNGNYYMVGNAGNGSATGNVLSTLSDNTGVQTISLGSSGNTTAVGAVQGSFGSATGYQRGFSLAQVADTAHPGQNYAADKTGKDNNFRGMTVFNDTLFVTKGSGSNGVNSVYQVGATGALGNGTTPMTNASISILNGFNTLSEKVAETPATLTATPHPFGLWFGDANTMFVADEGDGARIGTTGKNSTFSGLQEWKLVNGIWSKMQTFQQGLVGQISTPAGLSWQVQQDGLRNITGQMNLDGSFTLYGTTATVSNELTHDLGADPNAIVSITIGASSTAANTSFSVLETAAVGTRFGGVALAPVPEPDGIVLSMAGFGMLAFVARRRRAQTRGRHAVHPTLA